MKFLGELRRMLFAWEVRGTAHLASSDDATEAEEPPSSDENDPLLGESLRVVQEALEREEELQDELRDRLFPDEDE